jgi:hypothetical protein
MPDTLEKTEGQAAVKEAENIIQDSRDKQDAVAEAERIVGGQEGGEKGMSEDEMINSIPLGKVSIADPTLFFVLGIAAVSDLLLDPLLGLLGLPTIALPIINALLDIGTTVIIGGWMYSKSKQVVLPERIKNQLKNAEKKVVAKIEAKIRNKVAKKAMKRVLLRAGAALGIEMIPGVNIFTSWIAAVLSMVF